MSDFLPNPKFLRTINTGGTHQKDRISSLPDPILVDILTLIPLKSAVATSVLSDRWHHLWTHISHIILDDVGNLPWQRRCASMDRADLGLLQRFNTIFGRIMHQLKSPLIKTFRVDIPSPNDHTLIGEIRECSKLFGHWVSFIYARNVEDFKVNFPHCSKSYWPRLVLPSCVFESVSLVELTLRGVYIKFPKNGANLPNLKKLDIDDIEFDSGNMLRLLIHACPLLEVFYLNLQVYKGDDLEISGQNLKSMIIQVMVDIKLVIDAPVLEDFSFMGVLGFPCKFVKFPSRLIKAKLDIKDFCKADVNFIKNIPPLLDGIYNVTYLHLDNDLRLFNAIFYLNIIDEVESKFVNLNHLSVNLYKDSSVIDCQGWLVECPIPEGLISKLKKLELLQIGGHNTGMIMDLLDYILSKGDALEVLYVSSVSSDHECNYMDGLDVKSQLQWESEVCDYLIALSSKNPKCKFEFFGEHKRASRADSLEDDLSEEEDDENSAIGSTSESQ